MGNFVGTINVMP
jgi:hypothetical protein